MYRKINIRLMGGLGNQLFQYAFGLRLGQHYNAVVAYDIASYHGDKLRSFRLDFINPVIKTYDSSSFGFKFKNLVGKFFKIRPEVVNEKSFRFDETVFDLSCRNCYMVGYWQSSLYFDGIIQKIRENLNLSQFSQNSHLENLIKTSNSVMVHLRLGDYLNDPKTKNYHGVMDAEYYDTAFVEIEKLVENPRYFLFSDDLKAAQGILGNIRSLTVIESNNNDLFELYLMSLCKHGILANSSFSWWAAYLNENKDKVVITPKKWFATNLDTTDLIPSNWIRL